MGIKMRWLVTGGCGFIGSSLVRLLVEAGGHGIRVGEDLSVGTRVELASACTFAEVESRKLEDFPADGVEFVTGDILDAELALRGSFQG